MRQGSRCEAGAAPATVSGEIATEATGGIRREGAAIDDPEPGDLRAAAFEPAILGGRRVCAI